MDELAPWHQSPELERLRSTRLRPAPARKVLIVAINRIMGDESFSEEQRKQAGVYIETLLGALDSIERDDNKFAEKTRKSVPSSLNMRHMMGWAHVEVRNAAIGTEFDPHDKRHQELVKNIGQTVSGIEEHLAQAHQKYVKQQESGEQNSL